MSDGTVSHREKVKIQNLEGKDLYLTSHREPGLMEYLDKNSKVVFSSERMKQPWQPLLIVGIMTESGTVARPQERQKCSTLNKEGQFCFTLSFSYYFLPYRCAASDQNSTSIILYVSLMRLNSSIMCYFFSIC